MRAIILAAGRGSRMKELTDEQPKGLVLLRGKPLIQWQLDALAEAGIEEIAVVTGYKHELLSEFGVVEFYNPRWAETQMVSSLEAASSWLNSGPCIVSYSDIFFESTAIDSLKGSNASLAVTYDPHWLRLWSRRFEDPLTDAETFRLRADETLAEIGGKPRSTEEVQGQYMGLLLFTPEAWAEITRLRAAMPSAEQDRMHMTATLQSVIDAGVISVKAIPYTGLWGEFDSASDIDAFEQLTASEAV